MKILTSRTLATLSSYYLECQLEKIGTTLCLTVPEKVVTDAFLVEHADQELLPMCTSFLSL